MTCSRILAVLLAVLAALVVAPASQADPPPLSELCASLDANSQKIVSQGQVTIAGSLAAGEQLRIHTDHELNVVVDAPLNPDIAQVAPGSDYRYDVTNDGAHEFRLRPVPGETVSIQVYCGVPPTATITSPTLDDEIYVNQIGIPQYSCEGGTDEVQTCVADPAGIDTSSAGTKQLTVTATDTDGLQGAATVSYTVRKAGQTIEVVTELPTTTKWTRDLFFVEATATSGLPVRVTSDPASTACAVDGDAQPFVLLTLNTPGVCILHFDQAGNDAFLPAERVTRTIQVIRQDSFLTTGKTGKGLLGLSPTTFRAELEVVSWFGPGQVVWGYPGQPVSFWVKGKKVCTGTTELVPSDNPFDRTTVAVCKAPIGVNAALTATEYTARYEGDQFYLPSSAIGRLTP